MNEDQLHRCVRCSAETALRRPSLEEHQDVPITVPQEWPLCAACAVEHGQPDNDRHQLRAIKDALRIRRDAVIYYGHFDGSEIFDSPLRRYRIETASVCRGDVPQRFLGIYHSIEPGKYRLVYPWVYRLPRTSGPGVVIRWRFYKPGMQSHVVSWWDPVARRVRYEPRGLDLARRAEWDEMERLVVRLQQRPELGRPRGSGLFADAEEFRTTVVAIIAELVWQGKRPTQQLVAQYLDNSPKVRYAPHRTGPMSGRQLRAWITRFEQEEPGLSWERLKDEGTRSAERVDFSSY